MISGLMIDKIVGPPTPLEGAQCAYCKSVQYAEYIALPHLVAIDAESSGDQTLLAVVWANINIHAERWAIAEDLTPDRVLCYRALAAVDNSASIDVEMAWWRRSLPIETDEDRGAFMPAMMNIYAGETAAPPQTTECFQCCSG